MRNLCLNAIEFPFTFFFAEKMQNSTYYILQYFQVEFLVKAFLGKIYSIKMNNLSIISHQNKSQVKYLKANHF